MKIKYIIYDLETELYCGESHFTDDIKNARFFDSRKGAETQINDLFSGGYYRIDEICIKEYE